MLRLDAMVTVGVDDDGLPTLAQTAALAPTGDGAPGDHNASIEHFDPQPPAQIALRLPGVDTGPRGGGRARHQGTAHRRARPSDPGLDQRRPQRATSRFTSPSCVRGSTPDLARLRQARRSRHPRLACQRSSETERYVQLVMMQSSFRLAARGRPGDGGSAFTAPVTESGVGRNRPSVVGLLWALHREETALAGIRRRGADRLPAVGGRRRWPRRWSCSSPGGLQTQIDRPGDSGSNGSAPGRRRCAGHEESRVAGHGQVAAGWSSGCMLPAWQRGHSRNERPVSAS